MQSHQDDTSTRVTLHIQPSLLGTLVLLILMLVVRRTWRRVRAEQMEWARTFAKPYFEVGSVQANLEQLQACLSYTHPISIKTTAGGQIVVTQEDICHVLRHGAPVVKKKSKDGVVCVSEESMRRMELLYSWSGISTRCTYCMPHLRR
jgi:hypothetical protein